MNSDNMSYDCSDSSSANENDNQFFMLKRKKNEQSMIQESRYKSSTRSRYFGKKKRKRLVQTNLREVEFTKPQLSSKLLPSLRQ